MNLLALRIFCDHGRLAKGHLPAAIAIYEKCWCHSCDYWVIYRPSFAPMRGLNTMHPGDRPAQVDLGHLHRYAELAEMLASKPPSSALIAAHPTCECGD